MAIVSQKLNCKKVKILTSRGFQITALESAVVLLPVRLCLRLSFFAARFRFYRNVHDNLTDVVRVNVSACCAYVLRAVLCQFRLLGDKSQ